MQPAAIVVFVIVFKTVIGNGGQYLYKYELEKSGVVSIPALRMWKTIGVISCSKECVLTSNCAFLAFDNVSKTCILGSLDQSTTSTINVNVTSGNWTVFVDQENNLGSILQTVNETITLATNTAQPENQPTDTTEIAEMSTDAAPATKQPTCVIGWTYYNRSCYHFVIDPKTWNQSNNICNFLHPSAHLVVLTDVEERDFVLTWLNNKTMWSFHFDAKIWIGATNFSGTEGAYEWVNGEPWAWNITILASGKPSGKFNLNAPENCICMKCFASWWFNNIEAGKFMDSVCTADLPFVCEYEP